MMYSGYPWFGWWLFPFGAVFFLVFLFLVFRLVFWGWGGGWGRRRQYWYDSGDAHEILRRRYARGEITKEQSEPMNRDLELH